MWMLERYYDELTKDHQDRTQVAPVNISAVAEWFYVGARGEERLWDMEKDFPVVTPPFPYMWMEYVSPKQIVVNGKELKPIFSNVGCMAFRFDIPPEYATTAIKEDWAREGQKVYGIVDKTTPGIMEDRIKKALEHGCEAKWIVRLDLWGVKSNRLFRGPGFIAYIEPDGSIVSEMVLLASASEEAYGAHIESEFFPFLFATSLMHAKNVSVADDPLPDVIRRRRVKDGKLAITFKTLKIAPMRKQAKKEAEECQQSETRRAMHIVRGHFKDYRESGLFGRNKGLYWWDMHVAGDESAGRVIKDYKL